MKKLISALATIAIAFTMTTSATAEEKAAKERTITGKALCAHCSLSLGDSCATVIQVTRKGKDGAEDKKVVFWLTKTDASKALGKGKGQTVTVKGSVKAEGKKADRKMMLTATSIKEK